MDSKNRQRKIDIIQTFFLDDILDLWDYIKTIKVYYPNILYYANETDYFIFIINCLLDGPKFGYGFNRPFKDPEEKLIYTKIYQVTHALIETIFKKLPFLRGTSAVADGDRPYLNSEVPLPTPSSNPEQGRLDGKVQDRNHVRDRSTESVVEVYNWIDDYSELL
jgi:hypothetical protein